MSRVLFYLVPTFFIGCAVHKDRLNWQLKASDYSYSNINIYHGDRWLNQYELACDVSSLIPSQKSPSQERPSQESQIDHLEQEMDINQLEFVYPENHKKGVLVVICPVGAHSVQLSVYDPFLTRTTPLWEKTGSYLAHWTIEEGKLLLTYDKPCDKQPCDAGFYSVTELFSPQQ